MRELRIYWEVIAQAIRDLGADIGQPGRRPASTGWPPSAKFQDAAKWLFVSGENDIDQMGTLAWYCSKLGIAPAVVRRKAIDSLDGINLAILEMMSEAGLLLPKTPKIAGLLAA